MSTNGDPFARAPADPFAMAHAEPEDDGPPISYGATEVSANCLPDNGSRPACAPWPVPNARLGPRPATDRRNTYAVLAPIFAILVPPAGVALGHLALPQIRRTGERGWLTAVCGLVLGYLLSAALLAALVWLLVAGGRGTGRDQSEPASAGGASPSVVTSIAPPPVRPRHKIELSQATVGQCAEIEKRDSADDVGRDDALDLFEVPCQHRVGVYVVVARVSADAECSSTYVAAPPDRSFAVCLNRY